MLPGANGSEAAGINDKGQVVGFSYGPTILASATFWNGGTPSALRSLPGAPPLNTFANAINNAGLVVELADTPLARATPIATTYAIFLSLGMVVSLQP